MPSLTRCPIFQLDAFADRAFSGNPAAVMPMAQFPDDAVLQSLAAENNLSETAFLVAEGDDYRLRWFTPSTEVPLCGHATLASAAVVMERLEPERRQVRFQTASGILQVERIGGEYRMDFPARPSALIATPAGLAEALGVEPRLVYANAFNYLALLDSAEVVRSLQPQIEHLARLDTGGVIVTATGDLDFDFVSRYFAPQKGIPEDPVTGSAHCMLAPFWVERLGKTDFRAYQASHRGGEVRCRVVGERVELQGRCVFYLQGEVAI